MNHPLGRIGQLAENLTLAARSVTDNMHLLAGGDAYEYLGSTTQLHNLLEKLNDIENFLEGWIK